MVTTVTLNLKQALLAAHQALAERPPFWVISEHPTRIFILPFSRWRPELSNFNQDPQPPNLVLLLTANAKQQNLKGKTAGEGRRYTLFNYFFFLSLKPNFRNPDISQKAVTWCHKSHCTALVPAYRRMPQLSSLLSLLILSTHFSFTTEGTGEWISSVFKSRLRHFSGVLVPNTIFRFVIPLSISGPILKSVKYREALFTEVSEAIEMYNQKQAH